MSYYFQYASDAVKLAVWQKGRPIQGYSPAEWRLDACENAIRYADHGNTDSKYGWEIDHAFPKALGGQDDLSNLQPLHWSLNRQKGDSYPWTCPRK